MKRAILKFIHDEQGLTVVEYVVGAGSMVIGFSLLFSDFSTILSNTMNDLFSE
ncbi:Flp family type IVb pilin [Vibrio sp. SCSIO 43137]|uniref:Flp family type IVb pilin n=1 Tax=Vibrio sp. SCSIO 43137 TaxID=3021011 RepID=UPI002306EB39|nr:Flp family type IVb pilin [Vibrio sp. SCSIO 43137]WCE29125.1 Flp family type IVb pilin [Vibrio sp. SCSIO 43137]